MSFIKGSIGYRINVGCRCCFAESWRCLHIFICATEKLFGLKQNLCSQLLIGDSHVDSFSGGNGNDVLGASQDVIAGWWRLSRRVGI